VHLTPKPHSLPNPLSNQQAIQIRTSTDAKLRVDFDARPKFQQTSMFATKEVGSVPFKQLDVQ